MASAASPAAPLRKGLSRKGLNSPRVGAGGLGAGLDAGSDGGRSNRVEGTVNMATSGRAKGGLGEHCQHGVDVKAFTGRGSKAPTLRHLRQARADVEGVLTEMAALVALTLQVPGHPMYLCLHRRASSGQTALRWRRSGAVARHLSWAQVEAAIRAMPPAYATWYAQVDEAARGLNAREMAARGAVAAIARTREWATPVFQALGD